MRNAELVPSAERTQHPVIDEQHSEEFVIFTLSEAEVRGGRRHIYSFCFSQTTRSIYNHCIPASCGKSDFGRTE